MSARFCSDFGSGSGSGSRSAAPTGAHGQPVIASPSMRQIAPPPSLARVLAPPALPPGPLHGFTPYPQLSPYENPATRMSVAQAFEYQAIQRDYSQQMAANARAYDPSWQSVEIMMPDVPANQGVDTALDFAIAANDYDSSYYTTDGYDYGD